MCRWRQEHGLLAHHKALPNEQRSRGNEWSCVREELFSEEPLLRRHALDRIAVWRCRVPNRLATAIECTSQLVCAQLQETRARSEGALRSRDQELCMGYAMVLVRFVNLLTEKRQTKVHPIPIHALAEELGLPQWLVELRHDITHSSFPSLDVMREATHQALQWLKEEYWEAQQRDWDDSRTDSVEAFTEDGATELLAEFVQQQLETVVIKSPHSLKVVGRRGDLEVRVLETVQKLKKLLHTPGVRDDLIDRAIHDMAASHPLESLQINQQGLIESDELVLPVRLVDIWRPLLQLLHQSLATPLLLQRLLQRQSEAGGVQDRLLAGWVATIVTAITEGARAGSQLCDVYDSGCELNAALLVKLCLKNPNNYTIRLLNRLFTVTGNDVSPTQRHQLIKLVSLYTEANSSDNDITVDDTDRVLEEVRGHGLPGCHVPVTSQSGKDKSQINGTAQLDTRWRHMTELCDWSVYAFGDGPGCAANYTNLELDECVNHTCRLLHADCRSKTLTDTSTRNDAVTADDRCDMEVDINSDCDVRASETDFWTPKELYQLKQTVALF